MYLQQLPTQQLDAEISFFARDTAKYVQLYSTSQLSLTPVGGHDGSNAGFVWFEELKPMRYTLAGFAATSWALLACTQELYARRSTVPPAMQQDWPRASHGTTLARFEDALTRLRGVAPSIEAGSQIEDVLRELCGQPGLAAHNVLQGLYSPYEHKYWLAMHGMLHGSAPDSALELPNLD